MFIEHLNEANRLETLEAFDQLAQQRQAVLFALLAKHHECGGRVRDARLERCEQREPHIGVAHATEGAPRCVNRECRSSMDFRRLASPKSGRSSRTRRVAMRAS